MITTRPDLQSKPLPGTPPGPWPRKLFETLTAYQRSVKGCHRARSFHFDRGGTGYRTGVGKKNQSAEPGVRTLFDCRVVIGFPPRMTLAIV
jgi:hypothetical protein